jgi:hypothetical protein
MPDNASLLAAVHARLDEMSSQPAPDPEPSYGELFLLATLRVRFVVGELVGEAERRGLADGVESELEQILHFSRRITARGQRSPAWEMDDDARRDCLEYFSRQSQGGPREFARRLSASLPPAEPDDVLQRTINDCVQTSPTPTLDQWNTTEELAALQRVAGWFRGLLLILPEAEAIRRKRKRAELLKPFVVLSRHFRGRKDELNVLRKYVEWLPPQSLLESASRRVRNFLDLNEKPPLVVQGIGGAGKTTLLAKFILDHMQENGESRLPFIFVDFDQPGISLREPLTLLLEAARQLALQFPDNAAAFDSLRAEWQRRLSSVAQSLRSLRGAGPRGSVETVYFSSHLDEQDSSISEFAAVWRRVAPPDTPLLLFLDSFEEAQSRQFPALLNSLFQLLQEWSADIPRLRVVLAGRSEVSQFPTEELKLGDLDMEAAIGFLRSHGVENEQLARHIAERFGRNPLTLQLAATVARREGVNAQAVLDEVRVRNLLYMRIDALRVQQELFRRNLTHLHDKTVERLAFPGLAVRRISPEIIQKVLAMPCLQRAVTPVEAQDLFEKIKQEVSLISPAENDKEVRYRTDLRRALLPLVLSEEPVRSREIHNLAVAFHENRPETADRAEEIYHRLIRGDPPEVVAPRLLPGVEHYLHGALSELSPMAYVFLANSFGWPVPPEIKDQVNLLDWETAEANDLRSAFLSGTLTALEHSASRWAKRDQRSERSPLYRLEALLFERLNNNTAAMQNAQAALAATHSNADETSYWCLLMTSGRLEQRRANWSVASRYYRRAVREGRRKKQWLLAARAAVEQMRMVGRTPGRPWHFPLMALRKVAEFLRDPVVVAGTEPAGSDLLLIATAVENENRVFPDIFESSSDWAHTLLTGDQFMDLANRVSSVVGDSSELNRIAHQVFGLSYRQIAQFDGVPSVKAFDLVHYAETVGKISELRAALIPRGQMGEAAAPEEAGPWYA